MAALRAVLKPMAYQWSWGSCRQMSGQKMSRSDPIRSHEKANLSIALQKGKGLSIANFFCFCLGTNGLTSFKSFISHHRHVNMNSQHLLIAISIPYRYWYLIENYANINVLSMPYRSLVAAPMISNKLRSGHALAWPPPGGRSQLCEQQCTVSWLKLCLEALCARKIWPISDRHPYRWLVEIIVYAPTNRVWITVRCV